MKFRTLATKFEGTRQELLKLLGLGPDEREASNESSNAPAAEPNKVAKDLDTKEYSSMKVTELKRLAKERNLKGYSTLNKAALVELLLQN